LLLVIAVEPAQRRVGDVDGEAVQNRFIQVAETELEHRVGQSYKEAVLSCFNDDLEVHLGTGDFAMAFQKLIVQKIEFK